jgi:hypothetical protein
MSVPEISLVTALLTSLVPASGAPAGARLVDVTPVIGWTEVRCLESGQERQQTRHVPRVLGWLYRWARGFDIERPNSMPPLLYLRSPLLSGFRQPAGCAPGDTARTDAGAGSCFVVTASDGVDRIVTYLVSLPQLGAGTAQELVTVLRQRLDEGERVALKINGGGVIELTPENAVLLDVRTCEARTD